MCQRTVALVSGKTFAYWLLRRDVAIAGGVCASTARFQDSISRSTRPERLGLVEAIDHPSGRAAVLKLKQRPASSLRDLCSRNLDRAAAHTLNDRGGETGGNQLIDRIDLHPACRKHGHRRAFPFQGDKA